MQPSRIRYEVCVAAFPLDKGEGKAVSDKHRLKGSSIPALGNVSQTLGFFSQRLGQKIKAWTSRVAVWYRLSDSIRSIERLQWALHDPTCVCTSMRRLNPDWELFTRLWEPLPRLEHFSQSGR